MVEAADGGQAEGLRGIDATLGVDGTPQSGTGQTALLTGRNAAHLYGRHFGPWVPTGLRDLLVRENLFRRAAELGRTVAFANAYPAGHMDVGGRGVRRPGAFPFAAHAAGVLHRDERSVHARDAIVSSITTGAWRRYVDPDAPRHDEARAAEILARIAAGHDLTVFAHYDTDHIGHRGGFADAVAAIERIDRFLDALIPALPADALLLMTSDHGNLEEMGTGHTRNRVPLAAWGPGRDRALASVDRIDDVAPLILELLGPDPRTGGVAEAGAAAAPPG